MRGAGGDGGLGPPMLEVSPSVRQLRHVRLRIADVDDARSLR